jgi:hypothetical protein
LTKTHTDAVTSHAKELEQLKKKHATAVTALENIDIAHKKDLETLKATHAKNLDETHDRAITAVHTAHIAELKQLQADHAAAIAVLKKEHATSREAALAAAEKSKVNVYGDSLMIETNLYRLLRQRRRRKIRRPRNPWIRSRKSSML